MINIKKDICIGNYTLPTEKRTCIMGILNTTPDSFSDGGLYTDPERAADRAREMVSQGADIIDIGGESSRPGSERISVDEEIERVIPVIRTIAKDTGVPISIDTYKAQVARRALEEGASIVNDITALRGDADMASTVAEFDAAVVLMHMKGEPGTMQDDPSYDDVIEEIKSYLFDSIEIAEACGIDPNKIIVDPGIGFGKTLEHNLKILHELASFKSLEKPILVGSSRKAFIGSLTGKETEERVFGTAATLTAAIMNGANIVRVHDIGQMKDVVSVSDAILEAQ
ncbi:dihydropteroate synthase [Candidatus Omnitrophota bacterium]